MPTVYDGVATNVQAPDSAPAPEVAPKLNLPADGDPPNASTFAQPLKDLADHVAWLKKPQSKSADWTKGPMAWRAANGHRRAIIDHLGLPGGRIQQWNEMWERGIGLSGTAGPLGLTGNPVNYDPNFTYYMGTLASALTAAGGAANLAAVQAELLVAAGELTTALTHYTAMSRFGSHWLGRTVEAGAGISAIVFVSPTNSATYSTRHNVVKLVAGDTASDCANVWRGSNVCYDNDLSFAIEWEGALEAADLVKDTVGVGLCLEDDLSVGAAPSSDYAVFALAPGGGNWFCNHAGGGTGAGVDSGVAATTSWTRFRVEFHGANVADNAVRALRYYINGVQVGGDVTTNIPVATARAAAAACIVNTGGGSGGKGLRLGPMRFVSNIYGADVG